MLAASPLPPTWCACFHPADCGAGVGRVAKELLLHVFQEVDLLEPSKHLLETAGKWEQAWWSKGVRFKVVVVGGVNHGSKCAHRRFCMRLHNTHTHGENSAV